MSLPRKRESTITDSLDSRFRGNDAKRCPLGGREHPLPCRSLGGGRRSSADTKARFFERYDFQ